MKEKKRLFRKAVLALCMTFLCWLPASADILRGDVDFDGKVGISDITCLIDYLLNGTWDDETVTPTDDHEWVDLGLPSGTLWATCNVGANSPEEYGDYFAWGETESKEVYSWSTYKWCVTKENDELDMLTKYTDVYYGSIVDNKTELDPEDDAAYVNWGASWRIPTREQFDELFNNCSSQWTTLNDVDGRLLTGPNGNTLFLPFAGRITDSSHIDTNGYYWLRTLVPSNQIFAFLLSFGSSNWSFPGTFRYTGMTVRAVRL